jgi:hypothetical protein
MPRRRLVGFPLCARCRRTIGGNRGVLCNFAWRERDRLVLRPYLVLFHVASRFLVERINLGYEERARFMACDLIIPSNTIHHPSQDIMLAAPHSYKSMLHEVWLVFIRRITIPHLLFPSTIDPVVAPCLCCKIRHQSRDNGDVEANGEVGRPQGTTSMLTHQIISLVTALNYRSLE